MLILQVNLIKFLTLLKGSDFLSCTSPLYRVSVGSRNFPLLTGYDQARLKNHGVILPYNALLSYKCLDGWFEDDVQILPCGQCVSCRLARSRDWAIRCTLEASCHEHNYFLTITYDDFHLPKGDFIDFEGNLHDSNLSRRDIQLFIKNLREYERIHFGNTNIKVFYCGEYGELNFRPHYHLIVFGVSDWSSHLFKSFKKGKFQYYKSDVVSRFWVSRESGLPRGFVDISEASFDTIAYTARYCLKKINGVRKKEFLNYYDSLDAEIRPELRSPPFFGSSRRPGIAHEYFVANKNQILNDDLVFFNKAYQCFSSKPPKYFMKQIERDFPFDYLRIKRARKNFVKSYKLKNKLFSESYLDRQLREDAMIKDKLRRYERSL